MKSSIKPTTMLAFVIAWADILLVNLATRMILGAIFGLLGGGLVIISTSLGMRFEIGRLDLNRLKWNVLDTLFLGPLGGIAGGQVATQTALDIVHRDIDVK